MRGNAFEGVALIADGYGDRGWYMRGDPAPGNGHEVSLAFDLCADEDGGHGKKQRVWSNLRLFHRLPPELLNYPAASYGVSCQNNLNCPL
jgi:hypothetical protein